MAIKIYNTLTRELSEFTPLTPDTKEVKMYVCGVTVYDECHLGHARSAFVFDFIRRYLRYRGYKVKFVKNITDVDDKIINKAREEIADAKSPFDLNDAVREVAARYTKSFYEDMDSIGIERPDIEPKATEHIKDMIKTISVLIEKGHAYVSGGDVYFDVRKFKGYGRLSNQDLDQMLEGARIEVGGKKKDPLDFALWKAAKENEPKWDSPWGPGRPGWHIECSVMSMKYLGDRLDIHGGGRDLIFPHHENEIAQSECATGKPFANYWIHNGLLTINGEKMAKSLGNYVSIKDALSRYSADILKLFFLGAHYSHPIDFSWEKMEATKSAYGRFMTLFNKINREIGPIDTITAGAGTSNADIVKLRQQFETAMDDNFNTPSAIGALFEMVSLSNKILEKKPQNYRFMLKYSLNTIKELGAILGLVFTDTSADITDTEIKRLIEKRQELRKEGKFSEADKIREDLKKKGIMIEDGKGATYLKRRD
ncbi:MAG: cysteine--tRNA ligase [Candidatus Omnitrophota bacterium]|nr:cysteine--tRNA ligase [Candidatus Omnitrophota bacterium]